MMLDSLMRKSSEKVLQERRRAGLYKERSLNSEIEMRTTRPRLGLSSRCLQRLRIRIGE